MNTILTSPIVQLAAISDEGTLTPGAVCVPLLTEPGLRALREAYWHGEPWGLNGERILTLIEDPYPVLPIVPGGAK